MAKKDRPVYICRECGYESTKWNGCCNGCGECDRCDLDPNKICDNCMKCMGDEVDFRAITISGIRLESEKDAEH